MGGSTVIASLVGVIVEDLGAVLLTNAVAQAGAVAMPLQGIALLRRNRPRAARPQSRQGWMDPTVASMLPD